MHNRRSAVFESDERRMDDRGDKHHRARRSSPATSHRRRIVTNTAFDELNEQDDSQPARKMRRRNNDRRAARGVNEENGDYNDSFQSHRSMRQSYSNASLDQIEEASPPPSDDDLEEDAPTRPDQCEKFTFFFTKRFPFSNHKECELIIDGRRFTCTEHYYMWCKAMTFGDWTCAERIMKMTDPKEMKTEAKNIEGFEQDIWDIPSQFAMLLCNLEKYKQNRHLRLALLRTYGTTLVECNPSDQRWGIAMPIASEEKNNRSKWNGQNWLGEILTAIRRWMWTCGDFQDDVEQVKEELRNKRERYNAMRR